MKTENKQLIEAVAQICEVGVNYSLKIKKQDRQRIKRSFEAADILRAWYDNTGMFEQREMFTALFLNRANDFIGLIEAGSGNAFACVPDKKFILRAAILCNASSIILCHNHPSGNLIASENDKSLTMELKQASKLIDIEIVDHIILAPDFGYLSFSDDGIL